MYLSTCLYNYWMRSGQVASHKKSTAFKAFRAFMCCEAAAKN